jgi:hypothetical protein
MLLYSQNIQLVSEYSADADSRRITSTRKRRGNEELTSGVLTASALPKAQNVVDRVITCLGPTPFRQLES